MKLTADKNEFADAFLRAASFAPGRSPNEQLKCVLLNATKDSLIFTATDMEVGIQVELTGKSNIVKPGKVLLNREQTAEILKSSNAEELSIIATARGINLAIGRSEYKLNTANVDDYPDVAVPAIGQYHTLSAGDFCRAVDQTIFATDDDSARFALGGLRFELGDSADVIGTDGRRLAATKCKAMPSVAGYTAEAIVPTKACKLFAKTIQDAGDIRFAVTTNDVAVIADGMTLFARQVQGRYPNWKTIFPNDPSQRIEMTAGTVLSAIKQAAIVLSDDSRGLDFDFVDGQLKLCAKTEDGESTVEVPIGYEGPAIGFTVDNRFAFDFLKQLDRESLMAMNVIDSEHGVVLSNGNEYRYIIMPLSRDR